MIFIITLGETSYTGFFNTVGVLNVKTTQWLTAETSVAETHRARGSQVTQLWDIFYFNILLSHRRKITGGTNDGSRYHRSAQKCSNTCVLQVKVYFHCRHFPLGSSVIALHRPRGGRPQSEAHIALQ